MMRIRALALFFRWISPRHWYVPIAAIFLMTGNMVFAQANWPTINLPKEVQSFDIGEQVTVNGLPMRMRGFVSALKPVELAEKFRQSMGNPLVENSLANKLILGRNQGEYYLTVQLEPAGLGTRGVASVTNLKAAYENRAAVLENTERWLSRLPAGSQLLSQMSSEDAGKMSTHVLVINTQSEALNYERLKSLMQSDGFVLEQDAKPNDKLSAKLPGGRANGKTMLFKGKGKEAVATIYRDNNGKTAIVLNTITEMERFK